MQMDLEELSGGVTRIALTGDLDARGAGAIDLQFQAVAASRGKVLVDLSKVSFLASIGIRTLIMAAKANSGKGGTLLLLDPSEMVQRVLVTCGADTILPIVHGLDHALADLA